MITTPGEDRALREQAIMEGRQVDEFKAREVDIERARADFELMHAGYITPFDPIIFERHAIGSYKAHEIEQRWQGWIAALMYSPAPTAEVAEEREERIEQAAMAIYRLLPFQQSRGSAEKPAWVPRGNSLKQDEARSYARAALGDSSPEEIAPKGEVFSIQALMDAEDRGYDRGFKDGRNPAIASRPTGDTPAHDPAVMVQDTPSLKDAKAKVIDAAKVWSGLATKAAHDALLDATLDLRAMEAAPEAEPARCEPPEWAKHEIYHFLVSPEGDFICREWAWIEERQEDGWLAPGLTEPIDYTIDNWSWHSVATPSRPAPTDGEIWDWWAENRNSSNEEYWIGDVIRAALARFSATPATKGEA